MSNTKRFLGITAIIAVTFALAFAVIYAVPAHANPPTIQRDISASATTTLSYMAAGTATTTNVFDTQLGSATGMDTAVFMLQFTGSSTASILNVAFEYSPNNGIDCVTNETACDWYSDTLYQNFYATSSQPIIASSLNSYRITFASTTVGGVGGTSYRTNRVLAVPTPTRYIRAVMTIPIGALSGAVWTEFDGKKQNP
jgi:hypothetical protein